MVYRYTYCLNNPLIYTDPNGELTWFDIAAGISLVGGIITYALAPNPWSASAIVAGFVHFAHTINGVQEGGMTWDEASNYAGINVNLPPININWPSFNNNDVVEYDPGATYEHPVTGREYHANSGSEAFDNFLSNGGFYKNPGDMNPNFYYQGYLGNQNFPELYFVNYTNQPDRINPYNGPYVGQIVDWMVYIQQENPRIYYDQLISNSMFQNAGGYNEHSNGYMHRREGKVEFMISDPRSGPGHLDSYIIDPTINYNRNLNQLSIHLVPHSQGSMWGLRVIYIQSNDGDIIRQYWYRIRRLKDI